MLQFNFIYLCTLLYLCFAHEWVNGKWCSCVLFVLLQVVFARILLGLEILFVCFLVCFASWNWKFQRIFRLKLHEKLNPNKAWVPWSWEDKKIPREAKKALFMSQVSPLLFFFLFIFSCFFFPLICRYKGGSSYNHQCHHQGAWTLSCLTFNVISSRKRGHVLRHDHCHCWRCNCNFNLKV